MSGVAAAPEAAPAAPASLLRRFAALTYELLLLAAVFLVAGFLMTPLVTPGTAASGAPRLPDVAGRVMSFCGLFAVGALYFGWCWTAGRRTLPMKTWRLALVRRDGGPLDRRTALLRYAATWIGPVLALGAYLALRRVGPGALAAPVLALNFLWAFVDPDRAFLHDRIAGTRIVADRPRGEPVVPKMPEPIA